MESAVGMQLRSKASPADSIIQSATLHCRVGSAKCCWLGCQSAMLRQQTRRPARGLCKPLSLAKAGAVNILGSLKLFMLRQLHSSVIRYREYH